MEHIRSDAPGPGQDMAIEIIGLASTLYEEGNTLTVKVGSRPQSNEAADAYTGEAAGQRIPDKYSRLAAERKSATFLKRRALLKGPHAAEKRMRQPEQREENLPAPRAQVQNEYKTHPPDRTQSQRWALLPAPE